MTSSAISQPVNNLQLPSQGGGQFVVKQAVQFRGGDVLIGFSGSAWSAGKDQLISLELWLDSEPVPSGLLQMTSSANSTHVSLGHVWAYVPKVAAGTHTLAVMAGEQTITDQNDTVCITVWELGDNLAVHYNESVPCPSGQGQTLAKTAFQTRGQTPVMVSASTSGWATNVGIIGATVTLDGDTNAAGSLEMFMNNPSQHLPAVPTDVVFAPPNRGQHGLTVVSEPSTWTNDGDTVHVNVIEWVDPAKGPTIVQMSPPLQNTPTANQHGDGGSIASARFSSSGGTLLIRANLSAWSPSANVPVTAGIQIDGTSKGFLQLFTNWKGTHQPMVSNDLVVTGIPAGQHTLNLMGELNTYTDSNDRVSVTILEF
ncbi:MAG TPA: hypothetical protein VF715_14700 [Thermoleophilaceae bacterium]